MQKELWVRTDVPEDKTKRKELLLSALEAGISTALIRSEDSDLAELGKIDTYTIKCNMGTIDERHPYQINKLYSIFKITIHFFYLTQ